MIYALVILLVVLPFPAEAYIGPGLGLTSIGAVLAFFAAIFFVIVGFIWYPVKRLRQKIRSKRRPDGNTTDAGASDG